jgi:hypothetical protein
LANSGYLSVLVGEIRKIMMGPSCA